VRVDDSLIDCIFRYDIVNENISLKSRLQLAHGADPLQHLHALAAVPAVTVPDE